MLTSSYDPRIMEGLEQKREYAKKKVKALKGFYDHVKIFILINGFLYLAKSGLLRPFMPNGVQLESYYFGWVDLHTFIWGGILVIHGIFVFHTKLPFLRKWEARQIRKHMNEDREEVRKYK